MEFVDLKAELREKGKSSSRKLRKSGKTPAILYGAGTEPLALAVNERDFLMAVHGRSKGVFVNLGIEGEKKKHTTMVREIQRHPVKGTLIHTDFQKIVMSEKIHASVPVTVVGQALGVKEGGILEHGLWDVEVAALPKDVPDHIEIDISELNVGDTLRVSDLPPLEGVEMLTHSEDVLVTVVPPKVVVEEVVTEEVVEEPERIGEKKAEEEEKPES